MVQQNTLQQARGASSLTCLFIDLLGDLNDLYKLCLQDPRSGEVIERDLYVTRKGATPAADGQLGLIPGSMGQPHVVLQLV